MLQAVQRAELDALLQAAVTPSPSGFLPTPLFPIPTSPRSEICLSHPGVAVDLKHQDSPLHPPSGRGDKRLREAKEKQRVEYWRELLAYVDATYRKKFGRHYPWNNLARKNLWNLARVYSSWEVMALWDLYLERESWWAVQTTWSIYGMSRDAGRLMDYSYFKGLAAKQEENLAQHRVGMRTKRRDVFVSLFPTLTCKLRTSAGAEDWLRTIKSLDTFRASTG